MVVGSSGLGITSIDTVIISLSVALTLALAISTVLFGLFWRRNVHQHHQERTGRSQEDATEMTELQSGSARISSTRSAQNETEPHPTSQETSFHSGLSPHQSQTNVKCVDISSLSTVSGLEAPSFHHVAGIRNLVSRVNLESYQSAPRQDSFDETMGHRTSIIRNGEQAAILGQSMNVHLDFKIRYLFCQYR